MLGSSGIPHANTKETVMQHIRNAIERFEQAQKTSIPEVYGDDLGLANQDAHEIAKYFVSYFRDKTPLREMSPEQWEAEGFQFHDQSRLIGTDLSHWEDKHGVISFYRENIAPQFQTMAKVNLRTLGQIRAVVHTLSRAE